MTHDDRDALRAALVSRLAREQVEVDHLRYQFSQAKMRAEKTADQLEALDQEV